MCMYMYIIFPHGKDVSMGKSVLLEKQRAETGRQRHGGAGRSPLQPFPGRGRGFKPWADMSHGPDSEKGIL